MELTMYNKSTYASPIGTLTLASDGENLIGLWIEGQKYHGDTIYTGMVTDNEHEIFKKTKKWLDRYFAGEKPSPTELPLAPIGSEFRKEVWDHLRKIPYGKLTTYSTIAKKIAINAEKPQASSRAVGGAVGHNPISIIIPCHRVVGVKSSLTGYAAGVATKIKLLELEGVDISKLKS